MPERAKPEAVDIVEEIMRRLERIEKKIERLEQRQWQQ